MEDLPKIEQHQCAVLIILLPLLDNLFLLATVVVVIGRSTWLRFVTIKVRLPTGETVAAR